MTKYYTNSEIDTAVSGKASKSEIGELGKLDTLSYTSELLTNKPILGTMASKDDAASDGKYYTRKDGAWVDGDSRYPRSSSISISDCNDATTPGQCYMTGNSTANTPPNSKYWYIICFGSHSSGECVQLAARINITVNYMAFRCRNSSNTWSDWKQITLTSFS